MILPIATIKLNVKMKKQEAKINKLYYNFDKFGIYLD